MPQLEVATYSSQIFWLVICLAILFFGLKYIFIPRLETSINARQKRIEKFLQDAQKMQLETASLNEKYKDEIKKAYLDAAEMHKKAILEFDEKCTKRLEELSDEHIIKIEQAKKEIENAKRDFAIDMEKESKFLLDQFVVKVFNSEKPQKGSS